MISRPALSLFALCVVALATVDAFVSPQQSGIATATTMQAPKTMFAKKDDFDISSIESRDMTRAEMLELNKKNEDIMYVSTMRWWHLEDLEKVFSSAAVYLWCSRNPSYGNDECNESKCG